MYKKTDLFYEKKLKRRKLEIAVIHVCAKYALSLKIQ